MQAQLILQVEDNGKFNMIGPLENKLLCYGLLQLGMEAVSKHEPQAPQPELTPEKEPELAPG